MRILLLLLVLFLSNEVYSQKFNLNTGHTNARDYYEEIPFEFIKNKIIVPVEIEGKSYRFILDTGAPNIISKEVYEKIKPKTIRTITVTDSNEKRDKVDVVSVAQLKIGGLVFENTATLVYDLNGSSIFKCYEIDGFIGSNMLRNSILQVDLSKHLVILTDNKSKLSLPAKASKVFLTKYQSSPYINITLRGKKNKKEKVLMDTGDSGLYDLAKAHFMSYDKRIEFIRIAESKGASSLGLFGGSAPSTHNKVIVPKLQIGNFEFVQVVAETKNSDHSRIGAEILNYGTMTIDYPKRKFYFDPKVPSVNVEEKDYGFSITLHKDTLIVGYVWDQQLREQLQYGDKIIKINDYDIHQDSLCDFIMDTKLKELSTASFTIQKADGNIKEITLVKELPSQKIKTKQKDFK